MAEREKKVRTVVEVDPETRRLLKVAAAERGQTMKELIAELARGVAGNRTASGASLVNGGKPGDFYTATPQPEEPAGG